MRYLAGFTGGLVVAILLFVFQDYLISGERVLEQQPSPNIFLPVVKTSRPAEIKPYEPKEPPPEPEPMKPPVASTNPAPAEPVRPTRMITPGIDAVGPGTGPYVVSGGDAGRLNGGAVIKTAVRPQYPPRALRAGIEGEVEVEFTVLPDGSVVDVRVVRADPAGVFERSARRAVLRWQFMPKMENGEPVKVRARQVIAFRLPE